MKDLLKQAFQAGRDFGYAMGTSRPTYGLTFDEWHSENENQALSIANVMAMLPIVDLSKVNRVEVIDENGRSYVNWKPTNKTSISMQDDGKTLKVFIGN